MRGNHVTTIAGKIEALKEEIAALKQASGGGEASGEADSGDGEAEANGTADDGGDGDGDGASDEKKSSAASDDPEVARLRAERLEAAEVRWSKPCCVYAGACEPRVPDHLVRAAASLLHYVCARPSWHGGRLLRRRPARRLSQTAVPVTRPCGKHCAHVVLVPVVACPHSCCMAVRRLRGSTTSEERSKVERLEVRCHPTPLPVPCHHTPHPYCC